MNKSEFKAWATAHNLRREDVNSLMLAAEHADDDTLVGRTVCNLEGIAFYTDDEIVDACPFDGGFVVFGTCPNGDPVAIDVRNDVGTIHYILHEESDGSTFPSVKVAKSMQTFLRKLADDCMPTDAHEAKNWDFESGKPK